MKSEVVKLYIELFEEDLNQKNHRYESFDYCYNYFNLKSTDFILNNMELSCLQLGFYLASWGMFRGKSNLLQKSVKYYERLIEFIAKEESKPLFEIDVYNYSEENINRIINAYNEIKDIIALKSVVRGKKIYFEHKTLVSKIMLGVFGNIPAFDDYFRWTFNNIYYKSANYKTPKSGFTSVNKDSLMCLYDFYNNNAEYLDSLEFKTKAFDLISSPLPYPKAKLIDMFGFNYGIKNHTRN